MRTLVALAFGLACSSGCSYAFAPPVRGTHYGAPARLAGGRVEIGGAATGPGAPTVGGPHAALGIEDWVSIELGGNFEATGPSWAMGWAGARFTRPREDRLDWVGDVELGAGAGVGGADCPGEDAPCRDWTQITAGGGYAGVGLGVQDGIGSIYVRGRVEVSAATGIGVTFWPTAMAGADFTIERTVVLGLGGGYVGIFTQGANQTEIHGWFYQLQAAILFDWRAPAAPARADGPWPAP